MLYFARTTNVFHNTCGVMNTDGSSLREIIPFTGVPIEYPALQGICITPRKLLVWNYYNKLAQGNKDGISRDWEITATPNSLCADPNGNIYYLNNFPTTECIKLDFLGRYVFAYGDGDGSGINNISSVARGIVTNGRYIFIADGLNQRIMIRNCNDLSYHSHFTLNEGTFTLPLGITITKTHIIVLVSAGSNVGLKKYTYNGTFVSSNLQPTGSNPEQFQSATANLTNDETYIYITEPSNNRIKRHLVSDMSYVEILYTGGGGGYTPIGCECDEWWENHYTFSSPFPGFNSKFVQTLPGPI